MAHITPIGSVHRINFFTKLFFFLAAIAIACAPAAAQGIPTCLVGAQLAVVHNEGLTEPIGDLTMNCSGGTPGNGVITYLVVNLNANITNETDKNGNLLGISTTVSIDGGTPTTPSGVQFILNTAGNLAINGINWAVPNPNSESVVVRISNIRVAVPTVPNPSGGATPYVSGSLAGEGAVIEDGQNLLLGQPINSLLDSVVNNGIPCAGSPLPTGSPLTFQSFISNNSSSSAIRLTEASLGAFVPKDASDPTVTNGMRFLVNLSGYGSSPSVYVPNAIVGSSGNIPTSGGEFATSISGGNYSPGQLLLGLVTGTDANGNGGKLAITVPGSTTTFSAVTQIPLTNGAGYAVYEVMDTNGSHQQWAQVPVFLVSPANNCSESGNVSQTAEVAPVSTDEQPSATDSITRYIATSPGSDCSTIGDCAASYFPSLKVPAASNGITLSGSAFGQSAQTSFSITDGGQSQLTFTATTSYQTASGLSSAKWLTVNGSNSPVAGAVDPANGQSSVALSLVAETQLLSVPGTYKAKVTVDAGEAGTATVPITFNVGPAGPVIQSIVNSANFQAGAVTTNEFVSLFGLNLAEKNSLSVTFDGFPATILYDSPAGTANPTQINVLVPTGLGISQNAGVIATVDGTPSNTYQLTLTQNAPAPFLYTPTVLNQDSTVNSVSDPASDGDTIQIFLTGLAIPPTGQVTVNIGAAAGLMPVPGTPVAVVSIPGLEQVNVQVPPGLAFSNGSAPFSICVPGTSAPICSVPVNLYLH